MLTCHLEVIKILLEAGADINKANNDGKTAFDIASKKGFLGIVQLLKPVAEADYSNNSLFFADYNNGSSSSISNEQTTDNSPSK